MFNIYILGKNSFIAKNLYLSLKPINNNIYLLSHSEINTNLENINSEDVIINCCGVNRSKSYEDYLNGNYILTKEIIEKIQTTNAYFIHISSLMVYGFKNKNLTELSEYQQWFNITKLKGEEFIRKNYKNYCIIRPSNIYGYNCTPYYNNLLSSMIYEKINKLTKINNINNNCLRNHISIENICTQIINFVKEKNVGSYNLISNNDLNLKDLTSHIYNDEIPEHITLNDGEDDVYHIHENLEGITIIIKENLVENIKQLEKNMTDYIKLEKEITYSKLNKLIQERGDMVEISNLKSERLYKITLNEHSVRGNHFHYEQIEEFYNNSGKITYLLANERNINATLILHLEENTKVRVTPHVIHTLTNDFKNNISDVIIGSTQKFIENEIPDTKYINIV